MIKRITLVLFLVLALGFFLTAADYEDIRELNVATSGASTLSIHCGAGALMVNGTEESGRVLVKATIRMKGVSPERAAEFAAKHLELDLRRKGERIVLTSRFDKGTGRSLFRSGPRDARVDLEVTVPVNLALKVKDGSGGIVITGMNGGVELRDGSGSIEIRQVAGGMKITDGSGSLEIRGGGGDIELVDGSGSIELVDIEGNLEIHDGSGSLIVKDLRGNAEIHDGSGDITVTGVNGSITLNDGSGSIKVSRVIGDLRILEAGSGSLHINEVSGKVTK